MDQMLREAKTCSLFEVDDDDDPKFDDFDACTQIGNVNDLVAQTRVPDPAPVIPRASTNVIRRTTPLPFAAVRPSSEMPVVRAQGSLSDIQAPVVDEDAAFAAWDESAPLTPVVPLTEIPIEATPTVDSVVTAVVEAAPIEITAPPIVLPPMAIPEKAQWRWGAIAWVVLLIASISMGVLAYR